MLCLMVCLMVGWLVVDDGVGDAGIEIHVVFG
jgi:hypothetical protein